MKTERDIAEDQAEYLQKNSDVCADGNVHGWRWVRYYKGEWRATDYGGPHRLKSYVDGAVLTEEQVIDWLEIKPVTIIPATEATLWRPKDETVWDEAERQDVFTGAKRCFWCGESERTVDLGVFQTTEQGVCRFCSDCEESWRNAGEIVDNTAEAER